MKMTLALILSGTFAFLATGTAQEPSPAKVPQTSAGEQSNEVTPHHADEIARFLQEWMPPGDDTLAISSEDSRSFLGHYSSTKPFAAIWVHYATKLGLTPAPNDNQAYKPNDYKQTFPRLGPRLTDGHATLTVKNLQFSSDAERVATFIRREPNGRVITIFLASQCEHTAVSVVITPDG